MSQYLAYYDMTYFIIQTNLVKTSQSVNTLLILFSSFLVFIMQPGFALLEVGQVQAKNTANVAMKNLMDWSQGVLTYFLAGAAVASLVGSLTAPGPVSLAAAFQYVTDPTALAGWLFGAVFAMTAATIVSGAVAGRIKFTTYLVFGLIIVTVIYPVVQGMAWEGLLTADGYVGQVLGTGYIDFAGSTVVHMTGGIAGLIAAARIGPRNIRYQDDTESAIPGHSVFLSLLGAFILAFGWYGFNVGSYATVLSANGVFEGPMLANVAVNTTLAMGAGAIAAAVVTAIIREVPDPLYSANGLIAGLVAITAGAAYVTWWGSILIGAVGGAMVMPVHNWVVSRLQVDDAISVFPVHAVPGAAGTLLVPLFAAGSNGSWQMLGANQFLMQAIGITLIASWTVISTIVGFSFIERVLGFDLRVTIEEEEAGLDASEHNIRAYPEFAKTNGGAAVNHDELDTEASKASTDSVDKPDTETTVWRGQEVEISQKTEYERELEALTSRLELALDATDTGVWEWDPDTDEVIWDETSERLFGYEPGEFTGTFEDFADRLPADEVTRIETEMNTALETGGEYNADFRVEPPDGDQRWVQARGVVQYDNDGTPDRMIGIQTDITERKAREQELQETKQELEQSNEKLEQFAYVASHDLQEPLRMVSSYMDLLQNEVGGDLDDAEQEYFDYAINGAERMKAMIDGLLTYSRVQTEADQFEEVAVDNVLEETLQDLELKLSQSNAVVEHEELPRVQADDNQLGQVFQNLIKNAVEHGGENTHIEVTARRRDSETEFAVADDGPGIPEDRQNEIFGIFDKGGDSDGTGIGLAVCQQVVERHGGDIWIDSAEGDGTTFRFTIPDDPG